MDWNADPSAIPQFLYQVNQRTGMPVYIDNAGLEPGSDEIFEYTTIYLTGHYPCDLEEGEVKNIRLFLDRGGTLFIDDCHIVGSAFASSVPSQVAKIAPESEPIVLLKTDPLVSNTFCLTYNNAWPGSSSNRPWNYSWNYYLVDGRPAIFYSGSDNGCGWEVSTPPTAANPIGEGIGHGGSNVHREYIYQTTMSWILFALCN